MMDNWWMLIGVAGSLCEFFDLCKSLFYLCYTGYNDTSFIHQQLNCKWEKNYLYKISWKPINNIILFEKNIHGEATPEHLEWPENANASKMYPNSKKKKKKKQKKNSVVSN